jgi:very-short-patch-repair endonuclease
MHRHIAAGLGEAMSIPNPLSPGEEGLARDLACYKITVEREFQFDKVRKWRADFAIPAKMLLIEVEGGTWKVGRHNRAGGFEADCVKVNTAVLRGYRVLRFTTSQVLSGYAIDTIMEAIGIRSRMQEVMETARHNNAEIERRFADPSL